MLSTGPMLGLVDPIHARFFQTELQRGDRLFMYTDGLLPAKSVPERDQTHPIDQAISGAGGADLGSTLQTIVRSVRDHTDAGFTDDATIIGIGF